MIPNHKNLVVPCLSSESSRCKIPISRSPPDMDSRLSRELRFAKWTGCDSLTWTMRTLSGQVVLQWTLANVFVATRMSSTVLVSTNSGTTTDCAASRREAMKSVPTVWTDERQKELQLDHEHHQSRWSASIKLNSVAATKVCIFMRAVSRHL